MPLVVRAFPVSRSLDDVRAFAAELKERRGECCGFYGQYGVSHESWHVQETPQGPWVIVVNVVAMAQASALFVLALTGIVEIWHVYLLALVAGFVNAVEMPVRQAFVAELVPREDLVNAIALSSTSFNLSRVVGPAVAGVTIAAFGVASNFGVNAISYLSVIVGMLLDVSFRDGINEESARAYGENLTRWVETTRRELGNARLPIVMNRAIPPVTRTPHLGWVRKAQDSVKLPSFRVFHCDDVPRGGDKVHFNTQGRLEMGKRFAAGMIELLKTGE